MVGWTILIEMVEIIEVGEVDGFGRNGRNQLICIPAFVMYRYCG